MGSIIGWGIIYFVAAFFMSWWPFNAGNDILPFSKYEDVSVNAYFYFPDDREIFLGQYKGASACQNAARNYANSKNMSSSKIWSGKEVLYSKRMFNRNNENLSFFRLH